MHDNDIGEIPKDFQPLNVRVHFNEESGEVEILPPYGDRDDPLLRFTIQQWFQFLAKAQVWTNCSVQSWYRSQDR